MKLKVIAASAALGLLGASVAFAAPPPGKGNPHSTTTGTTTTTSSHGKKPPRTGAGCKPQVSVILRGSLAANGAAAPSSLSLTITGGNHFAAAYRHATQPFSLSVATTTRVIRGDQPATSADLKSGDLVNVQAKVCKDDLSGGNMPALTAKRVTAHAPKS